MTIMKYTKWHVTSPAKHDNIPDITEFVNIPCVDKSRDILIVKELGKQDNEHWHFVFTSTKSRNTTAGQLYDFGFANCKFSDPLGKKYNKYGEGSEYIYLLKGITNHMCMSDDITVQPLIAFTNLNESTLKDYREKYLLVIEDLKEKKANIKAYRELKNNDIWSIHLKATTERELIDTPSIVKYLLEWYSEEENTFTKHSFSKWYQKILKHVNLVEYRKFLRSEISNLIYTDYSVN